MKSRNFLKKIDLVFAKIFINIIRVYQHTLSPDKGIPSLRLKWRVCSHEPHCSQYGINVLKRYWFAHWIFKATDRVLHCTPKMNKVYDPDHYKIVFFSSAPIWTPFLEELNSDPRFEVVWVVTQCDKPSGRWLTMCENIIKTCAKNNCSDKIIDNVLLLDWFGWDGNWNRFPRLKNILESQGISVYNPCPVSTNTPILEDQLSYIIENYKDKINEKTAIIWHSLWCLLANHFITTIWKKIWKLISVAPAFRANNIDELVNRFPWFSPAKDYLKNYQEKNFNSEKLESLVNEHIVYLSDNDPFIPFATANNYYKKNFPRVTIKHFQGKWHFNEWAWITQLSEILSDIMFVYTPTKLNPEKSEEWKQFYERLKNKEPDFLVVIAYGKIIPQAILDIPKFAPINIHGSLLPKYRWASPIQSCLLNKDTETWITIMKMDATMDTWDMIEKLKFQIPLNRTSEDIIQKMQETWPKFLWNVLRKYGKRLLWEEKQDNDKATYCEKIEKEDWLIDPFKDSLNNIYAKYRAFYLRPKIYFMLNDRRVIVEKITVDENKFEENKNKPLFMASLTKEGVPTKWVVDSLNPCISEILLKPEWKKAMPRKEFLNGYLK